MDHDSILDALKCGRAYVAAVDGTMAFVSPEYRITRPDLNKIDAAIREIEREKDHGSSRADATHSEPAKGTAVPSK